MEKKNVVFLTVLAIATLLTAVVGTTFAFFTATVTGNDTATDTSITTATLGVEYSDGAQINATNIYPGWVSTTITGYTCSSGTYNSTSGKCEDGGVDTGVAPVAQTQTGKTITVSNTSSIPVTFDINWTSVTNTFVTGTWEGTTFTQTGTGNANFKYTLYENSTSGTVVAQGAMPTANAALLNDVTIAAASGNTPTVKTYVLVVQYEETDTKQDENQGKAFHGTLQVSVDNVSNS